MTPPKDVLYFGYAMLYAWCPQALRNWVAGALSLEDRAGIFKFLGLSPQWGREVKFLLHKQVPFRVYQSAKEWKAQLVHPEELGKTPASYSVWETLEVPMPVYSERLGFYDFVSGFYPLGDGIWSLILQKESYLRRLYPRYQIQAMAALLASQEMGTPIRDAIVVGWKDAEYILSLDLEGEEAVRALLSKTLEVLHGREPSLDEVGSRLCRYCFQKSCYRNGYLQELDEKEEIDF